MLWLVDYVWQRLLAMGVATEAWVLAQAFATEAWVLAKGYLTTSFVDRGNRWVYDFDINDFIQDNLWHNLDLSGIVPEGTKAVTFKIEGIPFASNHGGLFRTAGNSRVPNSGAFYVQVVGMRHSADLVVALPASRIIEYKFDTPGWTTIFFIVKGWWL